MTEKSEKGDERWREQELRRRAWGRPLAGLPSVCLWPLGHALRRGGWRTSMDREDSLWYPRLWASEAAC